MKVFLQSLCGYSSRYLTHPLYSFLGLSGARTYYCTDEPEMKLVKTDRGSVELVLVDSRNAGNSYSGVKLNGPRFREQNTAGGSQVIMGKRAETSGDPHS